MKKVLRKEKKTWKMNERGEKEEKGSKNWKWTEKQRTAREEMKLSTQREPK